MKNRLIKFVALCIYLQLFAGYIVAAVFANHPHHLVSGSTKKARLTERTDAFSYFTQVTEQEEDDDADKAFVKIIPAPAIHIATQYKYIPVFSAENRHFLIHYASSIKGTFSSLCIMHDCFLI